MLDTPRDLHVGLSKKKCHTKIFRNADQKISPKIPRLTRLNSLDVIRVTSLIVSYVFNYGYRSLLVAEGSPFVHEESHG